MSTPLSDVAAESLPPWLAGPWARKLLDAIFGQADASSNRVLQAGMAPRLRRNPPEDALPVIGWERGMPRYPGETREQYRARLDGAWDAWSRGGSALAIVDQLEAAGLPGAQIFRASQWDRYPDAAYWSIFWVFVPEAYSPKSSTLVQRQAWASIVSKWKPAQWICGGIVLELSGPTWGSPDLTYQSGAEGAFGRDWGGAFGGAIHSAPVYGVGSFGASSQLVITV
jgi:hypothetical protein